MDYELLGDTVRRVVKELGITPYEVAKRAGLPPQGVRRFLNRERDLTVGSFEKICQGLHMVLVYRPPSKDYDSDPRHIPHGL